MPTLYQITDEKLALNFHHGQYHTWQAQTRWVIMAAGTQGGKTSFGPWWLYREIVGDPTQKGKGAGDYLAVSSTYDLFRLKMLPEMLDVFEGVLGIGRYWTNDRIIELADPSGKFLATRASDRMYARIILRSAHNPGSLESATAKAAWLDEAGQDRFKLNAFHAIRRRLSLEHGRVLMTTTLYNLGWLIQQFIDPATTAPDRQTQHITTERGAEITVTTAPSTNTAVIQFDSHASPAFSKTEYEEAKATLPEHLFDLYYRGRTATPPGMIYGIFNKTQHTTPPHPIPNTYYPLVGIDYGPNNTAALIGYIHPQTKHIIITAEYTHPRRTAAEHAAAILKKAQLPDREILSLTAIGGAASEHNYRDEYTAVGMTTLAPPITDVEVGILRVYTALKTNHLIIWNTCPHLIDELGRYRRELDEQGNPTDTIKDKATFHHLDALRYLVAHAHHTLPAGASALLTPANRAP